MNPLNINVTSEIGQLKGVILHTPGNEVENMTPSNAERALYSDILNLSVASQEYSQLKGTLEKVTKVFEVKNLLNEAIKKPEVKQSFIKEVCISENQEEIKEDLMSLENEELVKVLIEGVLLKKDNLTKYLSKETYSLLPLPNFFFTRDASMSVFDSVFIGNMASQVREREALIMKTIFENHSILKANVIHSKGTDFRATSKTFEGGDVLVAREDVLVVGIGNRTTSQGLDFILDELKSKKEKIHIVIQELPESPESFIHLDMVFTFLDRDTCMVYEPLVLGENRYQTIHIYAEGGEVEFIKPEKNILSALKNLGIDLNPVICGGKDEVIQQREQWHSGANFFAFAPGKVIGYSRNIHTTEEVSKAGFEIIKAVDVVSNKVNIDNYKKCLVTIDGSELSRGGGGARCMTMPILRQDIDW